MFDALSIQDVTVCIGLVLVFAGGAISGLLS